MITRTVTITNLRGLHARAAAKFVTLAERYGASVDVIRDGQRAGGRLRPVYHGLDDARRGTRIATRTASRRVGCQGSTRCLGILGRGRLQ